MRARGGVRAYQLFLQYDADPFELAAQRRGQFRDRAFYVPDLPESGVDRFDDVHRHTFDRALRDAHLQAHDLVDREVVDRLFDIVFRGHVAQFGRDLQIDRKAVADLVANTLGNLVNRTIAMTNQYFGGSIRKPSEILDVDQNLINACLDTLKQYSKSMDELHLADAADAIMALARTSNKYIDDTTPWVLAKEESTKSRLNDVLYNLLESIRYIAVLISPLMPETSEKIFAQLNCNIKSYDSLSRFGGLPESTVGKATPLFARIDEKKMMAELQKEAEALKAKAIEKEPVEGVTIGIEDFAKVSLQVALIKDCEKVEKSDKLLKLQLDDGQGGRQVVSGIAKWYQPTDLIGKKVIIVSNLKPVKLRGVESNGMILAADCPNDDVKVIFVDDSIPQGSKIR